VTTATATATETAVVATDAEALAHQRVPSDVVGREFRDVAIEAPLGVGQDGEGWHVHVRQYGTQDLRRKIVEGGGRRGRGGIIRHLLSLSCGPIFVLSDHGPPAREAAITS
jgi:hypothetical protein